MSKFHGLIVTMLLLLLAACGPAAAEKPELPAGGTNTLLAAQPQVDDQGAVTITVTPLGLPADGGPLTFEVAMNTHSVELDMPLAELASLTTDNGLSLTAASWDGPSGGHHVAGTLAFALNQEQLGLLSTAGSVTLTIRDVDAPERRFRW